MRALTYKNNRYETDYLVSIYWTYQQLVYRAIPNIIRQIIHELRLVF